MVLNAIETFLVILGGIECVLRILSDEVIVPQQLRDQQVADVCHLLEALCILNYTGFDSVVFDEYHGVSDWRLWKALFLL